ncbi:hypothetical protein BDN72DRAFT_777857, partial [Pluteus cervinus]
MPNGNPASEDALSSLDVSELNDSQRRAYDIITWHLKQSIDARDPPPLRMLIHGEGGTGKSKVIQTVTQSFERLKVRHRLMKAAYTGIAASLIDGKTTHVIGGLKVGGNGK